MHLHFLRRLWFGVYHPHPNMAAAAVIQPVEISQNAGVMGGFCTRTSAPLPGSACAFKRAASMSANVRKVFILHDEGENATAARLRTGEIYLLDDHDSMTVLLL